MPVVMNSASATLMSGSVPASFEATKTQNSGTPRQSNGAAMSTSAAAPVPRAAP